MKLYLDLLQDIIDNGVVKGDRTGTGTKSVFGRQIRFDLSQGFPLLTTKKLHIKSIVHELLWFLSGDTNIKYLNDNGVRIWNEWADKNGDLGPIYSEQWRRWKGVDGKTHDQISDVIEEIKTNPNSRRLIVSAWNVGELEYMKLAPCHCMVQFYVSNGKLSCQLIQRSADVVLGVPFNIASYCLLLTMIAQATGLIPGEFVHTFGDLHLYVNHQEQAAEQLKRTPKTLPTLRVDPFKSIFDVTADMIHIDNYVADPSIKAPIAI